MTSKTMTGILSISAFAAFFIFGWKLGFSPLKNSFETASDNIKNVKHQIFAIPSVQTPADYISVNQHKIDILHYNLNIDLYPEKKHLSGNAIITGTYKSSSLPQIDLNFYDNMKITSLKLNNREVSFIHKGTRLSVNVPEETTDTFTVDIKYEGTPKRTGLAAFAFGEINGRPAVYNLNEPTYASTWFPCNDLPDDKALLDISITNDSIFTSVSNGVLINEIFNNGRRTTQWKIFYPISTYLISVYSSEYVHFKDYYISEITNDTLPIEYYVFPEHLENARKDFKEHPRMIRFFASAFGEYPFMKEKYGVAEFLWQFGAMEHQTITGIGSNFVSGRNFFEDVYVHELAHHWWGNAVGPKTWKDIWLNEGFSTYSEALYNEHKAGKEALESTMMSKFSNSFYGTLYDPGDNLFSSTIYDKGAWVLHMLRKEVGDSSFFKILREYYGKFKYKNASTDDFLKVCESVSGKNLYRFFEQWVFKGDNIIRMNIKWKIEPSDSDSVVVNINFRQIQDKYEVYHFTIDLRFTDKNGRKEDRTYYIDKRDAEISFDLPFVPEKLTPDPGNWLLADINTEEIE